MKVYFTSMLNNQLVKYNRLDDQLDALFAALADPTRRAILDTLIMGEKSVNELAAPFDLSLPAISKHLKVLEKAGLISRGRNAQWRPCRLEPNSLKEGADYMNKYRELWEASLVNLNAYVQRLKQQSKGGKK